MLYAYIFFFEIFYYYFQFNILTLLKLNKNDFKYIVVSLMFLFLLFILCKHLFLISFNEHTLIQLNSNFRTFHLNLLKGGQALCDTRSFVSAFSFSCLVILKLLQVLTQILNLFRNEFTIL